MRPTPKLGRLSRTLRNQKLWRERLRSLPKERIRSNLFRSFWRDLVLKRDTERHLPKRPYTECSQTEHISALWRTKANITKDALSQFFPSQPLKPCRKF